MPTCGICRFSFRGERCPVCGTTARRLAPAAGTAPEPRAPDESLSVDLVTGPPAPRARPPAARAVARYAEPAIPGNSLAGVVVQMHASQQPAPRNGWKDAAIILVAVAILPVWLALAVAILALRLVLAILGLGSLSRSGGRSLIADVLFFRLLDGRSRRDELAPVYHYVIETSQGQAAARQNGEFTDGRIFVGHRVRLSGERRAGVLHIRGGSNETLGTRLTPPSNPWRMAFVMLAVAVAAECWFLASFAGPLGASLRTWGLR